MLKPLIVFCIIAVVVVIAYGWETPPRLYPLAYDRIDSKFDAKYSHGAIFDLRSQFNYKHVDNEFLDSAQAWADKYDQWGRAKSHRASRRQGKIEVTNRLNTACLPGWFCWVYFKSSGLTFLIYTPLEREEICRGKRCWRVAKGVK